MSQAASSSLPPALASALINLLGQENVLTAREELLVYECDGLTIPRAAPAAVVFPRNTEQVVATVKLLREHQTPILPRGAGTGLAGGVVAVTGGVQVSTAKMRTIHQIDIRNRWALVDAGVPNLALSAAVAHSPYHFAPDPSSQRASTIGGNVATCAGGIHTLKHGVTINHILGVEMVLGDGSVHVLGGPGGHTFGPDLVGLISPSEGTLGIITRVWCKLTKKPTGFRTALAVFDASRDATSTVAQIIAAGITPAALEMLDGVFIKVVEEAFHFGFPTDAQAMLLLEIDGEETRNDGTAAASHLDQEMAKIETIARGNRARSFAASADPAKRAELWSARKRAFGALGRLGFSYCTQDACVPRSKLPEVLEEIAKICQKHQLFVTNCFHAGDGNVHPVLCFDENDPEQVRRTLAASGDILRYCISIGGAVSGEHGVGIEKLKYMRDMFAPADLALMHRIRHVFCPGDEMNPLKLLPRDGVEIDLMNPGRKVPQ